MTLFGVLVGNEPGHLARYTQWLGRAPDGVLAYAGGDTWEDIANPGWVGDLWANFQGTIYWSVPLIPADGTTLAQAATGQFNWAFRSAAEQILAAGHAMPDGRIFVRIGWEMGGGWFPWGEDGDVQGYKAAFRQAVEIFRSVSDKFLFVWDFVGGAGKQDPTTHYPGDAWVDVLSQDFYWNPQWTSDDASVAFDMIRDMQWGLQWTEDFAAAHGKPTAYAEWGVTGNNAAAFIEKARDWFESHNVIQATYSDHDSAYPGMMSDGSDPNSAAAYIANFGPSAPGGGGGNDGTGVADSILGIAAAEALSGDGGNDTIDARAGDDVLYGGDGADSLIGGAGNDYMEGGAGADTFVHGRGDGPDSVGDFLRGTDRLEIRGYAQSEVSIAAHSYGGQSGQIVTFADGGHVWLPGVSGLTLADLRFIGSPGGGGTSKAGTLYLAARETDATFDPAKAAATKLTGAAQTIDAMTIGVPGVTTHPTVAVTVAADGKTTLRIDSSLASTLQAARIEDADGGSYRFENFIRADAKILGTVTDRIEIVNARAGVPSPRPRATTLSRSPRRRASPAGSPSTWTTCSS